MSYLHPQPHMQKSGADRHTFVRWVRDLLRRQAVRYAPAHVAAQREEAEQGAGDRGRRADVDEVVAAQGPVGADR